jgi:ribosome maturation factor RimP
MRYTPREADPVTDALEPVINGLGMDLIELTVSRHKGSVQVRVTVYKPAIIGVDDCSRVHRAILPRLELTFPGQDLYVEVSSPGIDRLLKDGSEFAHYTGRGVKCYRTDISDWSAGIVRNSDAEGIVLETKDGEIKLSYEIIAKAKLNHLENDHFEE